MGESKTNALMVKKAKLHITTMPSATVKFIKGGVTVATLTANSSGNCDYEIFFNNFGSWTVSATSGNASGLSTVSVSDSTTYNVTVALKWYFIQNGNFASGISHNHVPAERWFYVEDDHVLLQTYQGGGNEYTSGYLSPAVSFGYWNSLVIDSQEIGDATYAGICSTNTAQEASLKKSVLLCSRRDTWDSRHTSTCSVSGVTGSYYLTLRAKAWMEWDGGPVIYGAPGNIRVWNMYLSG